MLMRVNFSLTHLRALLVLHDRGIIRPMQLGRPWARFLEL
jgi:hypothetical protein